MLAWVDVVRPEDDFVDVDCQIPRDIKKLWWEKIGLDGEGPR